MHHHLFQDIYEWAGHFRTVRIAKDDSVFCYPEHIAEQVQSCFAWLWDERFLQDLAAEDFAQKAAHFLAVLNAVHPFRDGNGRTQLTFLAMLADHAGHPLALQYLDAKEFLPAMIRSFKGDERMLAKVIGNLCRRSHVV